MEVSTHLTSMGYDVILMEKTDKLGGHLLNWEKLFPTMSLGKDVVNFLNKGIDLAKVKVIYNADIIDAKKINNGFIVKLSDSRTI